MAAVAVRRTAGTGADDEYHRVGCRLYDDPAAVVEESALRVEERRRWRVPPFTGVVATPP
ncbi:hypothetical protein [Halosegnis marinus]|uniref:hypothetical protein n=1 Tax=Halosegnis marinus TaxID=3034023 RepID=UPI00360D3A3C